MPVKKILILGSGMIAKPCADYLRNENNVLTIACRALSSAQRVAAGRPSANAIALDVGSPELDQCIAEHDLVISLVPLVHHATIIRSAIKGSKTWLKEGMKWSHIQQQLTGAAPFTKVDLLAQVDEVCIFHSPEERGKILAGLKWMELFSDEVGAIGERDLVMLQHKFVVEWKDGTQNTITSTLELFGEPGGYSAMAKPVGLTCGIAIPLLLDGESAFDKA
ncbi:hypothetical protein FGADI_59 [Fusarium gaditjirri]|uniref:Uncharacterized protein n=1 Tax=Fusarium gaditjirri TaxID=282569 RepID=A0A8H4X5G6_9HYPO|nr:hypothetical protein FGADI_59 [Fusarium gaditjirri]